MQNHPARRPALLIIDMQVGLFEAAAPPFEGERVLDTINGLIRNARAAGVAILAARHTGPAGSPLAPRSPATRLVGRLDVDAGRDFVFDKTRPNCFHGTALGGELQRIGANELVVVGMKTEYCVDTTVRAAADLGLSVVLIEDAHTTTAKQALSARQVIDHHNATLQPVFAKVLPAAAYRFA